jgi:hypothetical protein
VEGGASFSLCLGAGAFLTADSTPSPPLASAPTVYSAPARAVATEEPPAERTRITPAARDTAPKQPAPVEHRRARASDALAEEEALLERARRSASSAPRQALKLLREHRRQFPNGQLAAERLFLSVNVLERLGEMDAAREQARLLIARFPDSVYAAGLAPHR